jgi:hypothetical protein
MCNRIGKKTAPSDRVSAKAILIKKLRRKNVYNLMKSKKEEVKREGMG